METFFLDLCLCVRQRVVSKGFEKRLHRGIAPPALPTVRGLNMQRPWGSARRWWGPSSLSVSGAAGLPAPTCCRLAVQVAVERRERVKSAAATTTSISLRFPKFRASGAPRVG